MKAVDILLNSILPPDLHQERSWDKKSIDQLMADIANKHPERYAELAKKISDVGRNAAYRQGETLTLSDMIGPIDKAKVFDQMDREIEMAKATTQGEAFEAARMKIYGKYAGELEKQTIAAAIAGKNNLANTVMSGARGSTVQLRGMITTPALYTDYKGRTISRFVRHSFGEGVRPADYLAGAFGVRLSVMSTKNATADAGDLGKQLVQSSSNLLVTEDDCGAANGISTGIDDRDTVGRVLARDAGKFKAGMVIDRHVANDLRSSGIKSVIARSALTCQAQQGVCSHCLGQQAGGKFAPIGFAAGITAAQAIAEPLTQGALSCLVSGTLVRMADFSVKVVESICPGEWVLGADHTGMTFPVQVTGRFDQGTQPAHRYEFKYGDTREVLALEATEIHPILANTKATNCKTATFNHEIRELPVGTDIHDFGAVLPVDYSGPPGIDEPLAFIAGLLLGDGCYTQAVNTVHLSCADSSLIQYLESYLPPLGLKVVPHKGNDIYWRISMTEQSNARSSKGQYVKCGPQSPIRKFLISRGMHGKYAHEKTLPQDVWSWSDNSVLEFLGGLFSADGSVYTTAKGVHGVSLGMTSQSIVQEVKKLLELRFCIYSTPVYHQSKAGKGTAKHDLWSFVITRHDQIERFRTLVLMQGLKATRLHKMTLTPRRDTFFRCPRKSISVLGMRQTWDLEVDHPAGLFVLANGLIVHNTKHEAGAFKGERRTFAGFDVINQLMQSPETFPHRASVSELEGRVDDISDAPQGGKYITVGGQKHYALPGYEPIVKKGDTVETGDQLSDGIMDVNDVVRLRGLGEGRRYYVDRVQQALSDSGAGNASRRNLELIARGALDHVRVTSDDGIGSYLPDDLGSYNHLAVTYSPPAHVKNVPLKTAKGLYLHAPALHYSIGTKLSGRMVKEMQDSGVTDVTAHEDAPPFVPEMVRLRGSQYAGTDWLAKHHASNISRNIGLDAERARDTNVEKNVHFVPRLAVGMDFGDKVNESGEF